MKDKKLNYNNYLLVKKADNLSWIEYIASYKTFDEVKKACDLTPDTWVKYNGYKVYEKEETLINNIMHN